MRRLLLFGLLLTRATLAPAAVAPLSPAELTTRAEAIVIGTVVESRALLHRMPRTAFYYVRLKVKVEAVEKGRETVRGAEFIEVRAWRNALATQSEASGHDPVPADEARCRIWLTRHDEGYYAALEPNGFELLDGSAGRDFPPVARREIGTWQIVAGIAGLLAVLAAAFLRFRGKGPRQW